jgi:hypothetical protein
MELYYPTTEKEQTIQRRYVKVIYLQSLTGRAEGKNKFHLYVEALKAGKSVYEGNYGVLWGAGINGGI